MPKLMKTNMTHVSFYMNDALAAMVREMMENDAEDTMTDFFKNLIRFAYKKKCPEYIKVQKHRISITPEQKAEMKLAVSEKKEEIKKQRELSRQQAICDALGGTVSYINEFPHCTYHLYQEYAGKQVTISDATEPFDNLNDESVEFQYRDNHNDTGEVAKKRILALLAEKEKANEQSSVESGG